MRDLLIKQKCAAALIADSISWNLSVLTRKGSISAYCPIPVSTNSTESVSSLLASYRQSELSVPSMPYCVNHDDSPHFFSYVYNFTKMRQRQCRLTTIFGVSQGSCHLFVRAGVGLERVIQDIFAKTAVAGSLRPDIGAQKT